MVCMPKHLGSRNELIATTWLLDQGYEVFRNVSRHGEINIIATRGTEFLLLDVKTGGLDGVSKYDGLSTAQVQRGVKRLNVYDDGTCKIVEPRARPITVRRTCPYCDRSFEAKRRALYCSPKCSNLHSAARRKSAGVSAPMVDGG